MLLQKVQVPPALMLVRKRTATSEGVFPVDRESVFACKDVNVLLLLALGVAIPASYSPGAPHWLLRYEVVSKQSNGRGKASFNRQRRTL